MLKRIFALFLPASPVKDSSDAILQGEDVQGVQQHMAPTVASGSVSGPSPATKESTRAVLRDDRTKGDQRHLTAAFSSEGNLVFAGQDLGTSVEEIFGYSEYEWEWTIAKSDLPALAQALGVTSDLLGAIESRFRGPESAGVGPFLKEHQIAYESWSRVGN